MQDGATPLHRAAYNGHLEVIQLLLRHRADKMLENNFGQKPVNIVCGGGNKEHNKDAITVLLGGRLRRRSDDSYRSRYLSHVRRSLRFC